jgi:hypothetical protein
VVQDGDDHIYVSSVASDNLPQEQKPVHLIAMIYWDTSMWNHFQSKIQILFTSHHVTHRKTWNNETTKKKKKNINKNKNFENKRPEKKNTRKEQTKMKITRCIHSSLSNYKREICSTYNHDRMLQLKIITDVRCLHNISVASHLYLSFHHHQPLVCFIFSLTEPSIILAHKIKTKRNTNTWVWNQFEKRFM